MHRRGLAAAPHTVHHLVDESSGQPYPRAEGVFPAGGSRQDKYWSPVNRVDNVHGDRNLVCICPSPEEYREDAA